MTPQQMLERLRSLGVTVAADGDAVVLRPASRVPADMLPNLKARKPELLALLGAPTASVPDHMPAARTPEGTKALEAPNCGDGEGPERETAPAPLAPAAADRKAEDEALRQLRGALTELRPYLPKGLAQLPDDKLLALVNWSIMAAWTRLVEGMAR